MVESILSAAALGMLALAFHLFIQQMPKRSYLLPLMISLLALGVIISGPLVFQLWPSLASVYIAALPVAFLALPPSLYLYAQALTEHQPWHWKRQYLRLYWAQLIGIPLALLIYTLPAAEQQTMFFSDSAELQGQLLFTAISFLLVTLLWLVLSLFYLIRITTQLRSYRRQLRQVLAADAGKRLDWLDGLTAILIVSWSYAALVFVAEERIGSPWLSETGVLLLALVLVWLLCVCGLRQRPGFAVFYGNPEAADLPELVANTPVALEADKYQRSALGEEQAKRIAEKVSNAVYEQALYLDSTLTLYKLAAHIGVSAQYLSQTLNQTLQLSFYDYVNEARIAAAKQQLRQTDDSVLTIAMAVGFNARSSFYKAFKASTGITPAQYRAQLPADDEQNTFSFRR